MCGIVGYAGNKSVESVLMVGLACLEYRGYDSAGIAVIDNDELEIRKEKGKSKHSKHSFEKSRFAEMLAWDIQDGLLMASHRK